MKALYEISGYTFEQTFIKNAKTKQYGKPWKFTPIIFFKQWSFELRIS